MADLSISRDDSVAHVLRLGGNVAEVFNAHRTACVGCYLARFCTLRDVAVTYALVLDDLIVEIEQAAQVSLQSSERSLT